MNNYKSFAKLTYIIIHIFILALFVLMAILPFGIQWYAEVKGRSAELATVVMLTCYPCSPFAVYTLFALRKFIGNIMKDDFFNKSNFTYLKGVAICCLAAGVIMLVAGIFYMPFYIGGAAAVFCSLITMICKNILLAVKPQEEDDKKEIVEYMNTNFMKDKKIKESEVKELKDQELVDYLTELVIKDYTKKMEDNPNIDEFEKAITLRVIDSNWVDHMSAMEHLKEGIGLRGYGQVNPIQAYTMEGFNLFDELLNKIDSNVALFLLKAEVRHNIVRKQTLEGKANDGKEKVKATPKRSNKINRNDPCPCGSNKKYKQCCGK